MSRQELLKQFWHRMATTSGNPPLFFANISRGKRMLLLTTIGLASSWPMFSLLNKGNYVNTLNSDFKEAMNERRRAQLMDPLGGHLIGGPTVTKEELHEFYHGEETQRLQQKYGRHYEHKL